MTAADFMRALMLLDIVAMALFAIFYLRRRPLPWLAFLGWGLLAVLVPILGPFLVIAAHPGIPRFAPPLGGPRRRTRLPRVRFARLR